MGEDAKQQGQIPGQDQGQQTQERFVTTENLEHGNLFPPGGIGGGAVVSRWVPEVADGSRFRDA